MLSKPLAFGLLVAASVAAAGGGAYFATLHQARESSAEVPQHLEANSAAATTPRASEPSVAAPVAPQASTAPIRSAEPLVQIVPPPKETGQAAEKSQVKPTASEGTISSGQFVVPPPAARATEASSPAPPAGVSLGVDPNPQTQRPWPGPPVSTTPVLSGVVSEPARVEQEPAPLENVKPWLEVVVPTESVLGLQLESSISTEYARVEDRVDARVTRDVRVGGRVAIPAGTHALGSVMLVEKGGKVKERSKIGIRFHTLVFADASRVTITTDTVYREGESPANQSSAKIGGAAIGGAIIGAILGGGKGAAIGSGIGAAGGTAATMAGSRLPVVLPAGTTLSVRTQSPISLTVEK